MATEFASPAVIGTVDTLLIFFAAAAIEELNTLGEI